SPAPHRSTPFPYTTLFRSSLQGHHALPPPPYTSRFFETRRLPEAVILSAAKDLSPSQAQILRCAQDDSQDPTPVRSQEVFSPNRSEEHTSELQSRFDLVCR